MLGDKTFHTLTYFFSDLLVFGDKSFNTLTYLFSDLLVLGDKSFHTLTFTAGILFFKLVTQTRLF